MTRFPKACAGRARRRQGGMRNVLLLLAAAPLLGGCVASLAASAVGAAVQAAGGGERPVVTQDRRPQAREACRARAAAHGEVHVIDLDQRADGRVTVWGTVRDAQRRQSFECIYDQRVISFRLREIRTR